MTDNRCVRVRRTEIATALSPASARALPRVAVAEPIRPRLHCDLAPPISYVWEHTGAWEQSPFEKPGKLAWSCCMCGEKDSKGCKSKQMRLEGWQYVSYG